MSELKVKYVLSDEFRKRMFADTGAMPERENVIAFDAATLTPAQRAAIVAYAGTRTTFDLACQFSTNWIGDTAKYVVNEQYHSALFAFDHQPDPAAIATACASLSMEMEALRKKSTNEKRTQAEKELARNIAKLEDAITEHESSEYALGLSQDDRTMFAAFGFDLSKRDELHAQYNALKPEFVREKEERRAAKQLAEEQEKERKAQADAKAHAEKLVWAKEHGSDQLRRGLEAEHTCSRLYAIERAAMEYPSCMLDYEKDAEWKDRSCPSVKALDLRDAMLKSHPDADVNIVWLTCAPSDKVASDNEEWDGEQFEECEVVQIDSPDFDRYIYKYV